MKNYTTKEFLRGVALLLVIPGLYALLHNEHVGFPLLAIATVLFFTSFSRPSNMRTMQELMHSDMDSQSEYIAGDDKWLNLFQADEELKRRLASLPPKIQSLILSDTYRDGVITTMGRFGLGTQAQGAIYVQLARLLVGMDSERTYRNFILTQGLISQHVIDQYMDELKRCALLPVREAIISALETRA